MAPADRAQVNSKRDSLDDTPLVDAQSLHSAPSYGTLLSCSAWLSLRPEGCPPVASCRRGSAPDGGMATEILSRLSALLNRIDCAMPCPILVTPDPSSELLGTCR